MNKFFLPLLLVCLCAANHLNLPAATTFYTDSITATRCCASSPTAETDTSSTFRPQRLIAPAALIVAGATAANPPWGWHAKRTANEWLAKSPQNKGFKGDNVLQFLPLVANLSLAWTGAKAQHDFRDRTLVTATSFVAMELLTRGTKALRLSPRPDGSDWHSFPSGHTARAFLGAELVRREYGWRYGGGAYAFAVGIGVLRVYNARHWWADVVGGAGFGIVSAQLGYWLLPLERRWLGLAPTISTQVAILPTFDPQTTTPTLGMVVQF